MSLIKIVTLVLVLLWAAGDSYAGTPITMPYIEKDDPPVAVVYTVPGKALPLPGREFEFYQVHVAFWLDGRMVWSGQDSGYGYPYYEGQVNQAKVKELLSRGDNFSALSRKYKQFLILDARSVHIAINSSQPLSLASSHPYFRSDKVAIRSTGISAKAADPVTTLSEIEIRFQHYLKDFDELQSAMQSLIPQTTTTVARKLKFHWNRDQP